MLKTNNVKEEKNVRNTKTNVGADASVCPSTKEYPIRRGTGHRAQEPAAITLVALVITVIILIILAGVSLNLALGENGIFVKSKQAVDKYKDEAQKEQNTLENIYQDMQAETGGGADETGKGPYLPNNFTEVKDETSDDSYIIKDESGNEFVWIPVETPVAKSEEELTTLIEQGKYPMAVKIEGKTEGLDNYRGVLYDFALNATKDDVTITPIKYSASSGFREPANLTDTVSNRNYAYDSEEAFAANNGGEYTSTMYQKEYNELVESVIANGGFYIGRYESSVSGNKAASKKDQTPMTSITWYKMYKNQKNIYDGATEPKTHMIWGSEWDQVMIYLKDVPNNNEGVKNRFFILDSTKMGSYKDNGNKVVQTGTDPDYAVKGIYDLAGNVWEWTMEASNTTNRSKRGGSFDYTASIGSAIHRNVSHPDSWMNEYGSRLTLYK